MEVHSQIKVRYFKESNSVTIQERIGDLSLNYPFRYSDPNGISDKGEKVRNRL